MDRIEANYVLGDKVKIENEDGYIVPGYIAHVEVEDVTPTYLVKTDDEQDAGTWCTVWDFN